MSRREFLENGFTLALLAGAGLPRLMRPGPSRKGMAVQGGPRPRQRSRDSLGRFFGAQTHFGQHRAGIEETLDLIKDAGIGWIRDEVYWSQVEKERGVFRFPPD